MPLEVLRLDNHLGFWNPRTKKRVPNLYPNKTITIKTRADRFIGGFNYMQIGDIHHEVSDKYISYARYRKLSKKYKSLDQYYK
jgi:hypothetical protein